MAELLAVTGFMSSGKDRVASILHDQWGFETQTTSDVIRDYIKTNELGEPTRPLLFEAARTLRAKDPAAIVKTSISRCSTDRIALSGLYSRAEAEYFVGIGGSIINCEANLDSRYIWALERGRIGDDIDIETFKQWQKLEASSEDPRGQSILDVGKLAVFTIVNNGTLQDIEAQVGLAMDKLGVLRSV